MVSSENEPSEELSSSIGILMLLSFWLRSSIMRVWSMTAVGASLLRSACDNDCLGVLGVGVSLVSDAFCVAFRLGVREGGDEGVCWDMVLGGVGGGVAPLSCIGCNPSRDGRPGKLFCSIFCTGVGRGLDVRRDVGREDEGATFVFIVGGSEGNGRAVR